MASPTYTPSPKASGDVAYLDSRRLLLGNDLLAFADARGPASRGNGYENVVQGFGLVYATGSERHEQLGRGRQCERRPELAQHEQRQPVSYSDGNELVQAGFGNANLVLEAGQVAALDFVLQQLGGYQSSRATNSLSVVSSCSTAFNTA